MNDFMKKFSLEGRKAIITGGARGLDYGIAEGFRDAGAEIVLLDINEQVYKSAETLSRPETPVHGVIGDVSDTGSLKKAYSECLEKLGDRVDILVNGAGIQYRSYAEDFPEDMWKKIIDINLNGLFFMSQIAGKTMLAQGYGRIINIASLSSFFGASMIAAYTASKGGVAQLTKVLSTEWAGRGVNVNAIAPGYMKTELTADIETKNPEQYKSVCARIPKERWGTAEDLKGIAVFLASEASEYITGTVTLVDGGYSVK
ncbi:MAG: SDR family oxidoreductase [Firmicutes bacterium]|nr:SDR family oxidoreductase [Bacillota bacterium]